MADTCFYWGSGSIPCWRAAIALEEKGVKYTDKLLSFSERQHKSPEILKLNPRGQLPVLKDGDIVVNESVAICEYLEITYKGQATRLLPEDKCGRACTLQRTHEADNLFRAIREPMVMIMFGKQEPAACEEKFKVLRTELAIWEKHLETCGADSFIAGKTFSMADIMVFPSLALGVRVGLKLEKFPRLCAYYGKIKERPSVKKTSPPHWKESTPPTHFSTV